MSFITNLFHKKQDADVPAPYKDVNKDVNPTDDQQKGDQPVDGGLFAVDDSTAAKKKAELAKKVSGTPSSTSAPHAGTDDPMTQPEQDDSKDPMYNNRRAAKEDDYVLPKTVEDRSTEAVTVGLVKVLMSDPHTVATQAKDSKNNSNKDKSEIQTQTASEPRANTSTPLTNNVKPRGAYTTTTVDRGDGHPRTSTTLHNTTTGAAMINNANPPVNVSETTMNAVSSGNSPIHLTIHPDPEDPAATTRTTTTQQQQMPPLHPVAYDYMAAVHEALPVHHPIQQQPGEQHKHTEGAALSLNGQWAPLEPAAVPQSPPQPISTQKSEAHKHPLLNATVVDNTRTPTNSPATPPQSLFAGGEGMQNTDNMKMASSGQDKSMKPTMGQANAHTSFSTSSSSKAEPTSTTTNVHCEQHYASEAAPLSGAAISKQPSTRLVKTHCHDQQDFASTTTKTS